MINYNLETQFTVRCSKKLREDVERCARERGQTIQEWIRRSMQDSVDRQLSEDNKDALLENIKSIFYDPEFKEYLKSIFKGEEGPDKNLKYAVFIKDDLKEMMHDPEFKKYLKDNIIEE